MNTIKLFKRTVVHLKTQSNLTNNGSPNFGGPLLNARELSFKQKCTFAQKIRKFYDPPKQSNEIINRSSQ